MASFFIFGSISLAIGLAVITDAVRRRIRGDDRLTRMMSGVLKWQQMNLGLGFAFIGVVLLGFALSR